MYMRLDKHLQPPRHVRCCPWSLSLAFRQGHLRAVGHVHVCKLTAGQVGAAKGHHCLCCLCHAHTKHLPHQIGALAPSNANMRLFVPAMWGYSLSLAYDHRCTTHTACWPCTAAARCDPNPCTIRGMPLDCLMLSSGCLHSC